jgi:glycolate oxidase FAD binding subunit
MSNALAVSPVKEFADAMRSALGDDAVFDGHLDEYAVDAAIPDVAVAPSTVDGVQAVLAEASECGLAVLPFGGGTHMGAGNAPEAYDVALSLRRMSRIIAHEPADLTVTVEPGVTLYALQETLAAHRQTLPLDPPCGFGATTIGGLLGSNASGPLRHAYGTARDWLLGVRVVHADGMSSKSGGRVVKNVTGYDMHKLYVGSLGTLGVIVEATFKLAPLPKTERTVAIECHSAREAARIALSAHDEGLSLHAAELLSPPAAHAITGDARWTLLARVAGGEAAVGRSLRELSALAATFGASVQERDGVVAWRAWSEAFRPEPLSLRVCVMPSAVADTIQVLDRQFIGGAGLLSSTITAGVIRARLHPSREARAHTLASDAADVASRHEGFAVIDAAPMSLKRQIDVFGSPRSDLAIMRRLKEQFDPKRVLAPGRFVGRL